MGPPAASFFALLLQIASGPATVPAPLEAVAWRPLPGDTLVLAGGGRVLVLLDLDLREQARWSWSPGRVAEAAAWAGRWWLRPATGDWGLLPDPPPGPGPWSPGASSPPRPGWVPLRWGSGRAGSPRDPAAGADGWLPAGTA